MTHQHKVSYGYFPDFKGESVVLFVGDRAALENLAEFLEALSISREQVKEQKIPLKVELTPSPCDMRRINSAPEETYFEWSISKNSAMRFAELTRAIAASESARLAHPSGPGPY